MHIYSREMNIHGGMGERETNKLDQKLNSLDWVSLSGGLVCLSMQWYKPVSRHIINPLSNVGFTGSLAKYVDTVRQYISLVLKMQVCQLPREDTLSLSDRTDNTRIFKRNLCIINSKGNIPGVCGTSAYPQQV